MSVNFVDSQELAMVFYSRSFFNVSMNLKSLNLFETYFGGSLLSFFTSLMSFEIYFCKVDSNS